MCVSYTSSARTLHGTGATDREGEGRTQENLDVVGGLEPAAPGEMQEAGLALEDAGEFGHLVFDGGVGLEFELDDFGDWLGHGVWNGGGCCLCCDEGVCEGVCVMLGLLAVLQQKRGTC